MTFTSADNALYVVAMYGYTVRKVDVATNIVSTVAGKTAEVGAVDASGTSARLSSPYDLVVLPGGGSTVLVVADVACLPCLERLARRC